MRRLVPLLACALVALLLVPVAAQANPAARAYWDPGDSFVPVAPVRVLDTRVGTGGPAAPVTGGIQLDLSARVPTLATAVVLNLTGTEPTAATYVRVSPTNENVPEISNLNLVPGETRANLVTVALPEDRKIFLFNNAGSVHLIADLAGYYT